MKRVVQALAAAVLAALALMLVTTSLNSSQGYAGGNTIILYSWGDYIDPDLLDEFYEETGIKVVLQTFDSNEAMLTKLSHGGTHFDVAVPSEYAVAKMMEQGMLLPLDHSKIPNLEHIDPRFLDMPFDAGNVYSVPYFWGTVGIVYNPEMVGGKTITRWNDLWDPELRNEILLVDSAREVIGIALNSLGYSLNDTDLDHLEQAKQRLIDLIPNVKAIVGDEIKLLLAGEEAAIGVVWSGDAYSVLQENDRLDYVVPEEGSNLWFDNFVIPVTAKNVEAAHEFINFMLDPEVAARNTEYVGYSTPNAGAMELLDEEIVGDVRFYPPPELTARLEVYENLGKQMLAHYNKLFLEFKMHGN